MYCIDLKALKKNFDEYVKLDIEEFGKHAFVYNFHHQLKQINAMDTEDMWNVEKTRLQKQGWDLRKLDKDIEINKKKWKSILWVAQPLKNGQVDEQEYKKNTDLINDPLALCIGYMTSGFCYIQLLE